ncbi:MAG: ribonuclease H-like domain-containing protein [Candidatus Hermodarchaeota archaeon]
MNYYNFESVDITRFIEEYRGKKLEDIFRNNNIISNGMGKFMELTWEDSEISCNVNLSMAKKKVLRNLKTVYFIGENIEKQLYRRGVRNLYDLKFHLRYRNSVMNLLNLIKQKNYSKLRENRYVYDIDVSFCFDKEDLLFLDIETLGIYDSPIIIIGFGFFRNNKFEIKILFARELEEEIAICEYFKSKILPKYKCFVTYNGKSFDIPYLANRFLYFFDENPMISEDDVPFEKSNTIYHHIDLYHNCRRRYKGLFNNYTLTNMEESLLGLKRQNELPSNLVGFYYRKYLKDRKRYIGLIKEIIEHNYYDVYSMPLILEKLLIEKLSIQ